MQAYLDPETNEELFNYFQYRVIMKFARPESYREDMELVKDIHNDGIKLNLDLIFL